MSSLADLPDLVGFFSYARSDDVHTDDALSQLRRRISAELRVQLGRELRLWQDRDAIAYGTQWKDQIQAAIAESVFFIPIVSPSALNSRYCRMEFDAFLMRERELARDDLIFPILYVPVPGRVNSDQEEVLKIVKARQCANWTELRLIDAGSLEVKKAVARFCKDIVGALHKGWEKPKERRPGAPPRHPQTVAGTKREAEAGSPVPARDAAMSPGGDVSQSVVISGNDNVSLQVSGGSNVINVSRSDAAPQPGDGEAGDGRTAEAGAVSSAGKPQRSGGLAWMQAFVIAAIVGGVVWDWVWSEQRAPRSSSQPSPGDLGTPSDAPAPAPVTDAASASPLSSERERALKPKDTFRECADCPEMVVVPAGSFTMGSPENENGRLSDEGPQHPVTISRQFAVGELHVTVDQFAAFVRETGYEASSKCFVFEGGKWVERADRSWRNPGFAQEGSHPAVCLAWNDAKAYVDWMAKKTGKPYRMLSEAEWEYAARGRTSPGTYPRFWFGEDEKDLCRYGNGADQTVRDGIEGAKGWPVAPCNDRYAYTSPAGHSVPNAFGLYDMAGNAWQWTADCYHNSYVGAPADGSAWTTATCSSGRVVRGGSWENSPWFLRSAQRIRVTGEDYLSGFRLARTLTP